MAGRWSPSSAIRVAGLVRSSRRTTVTLTRWARRARRTAGRGPATRRPMPVVIVAWAIRARGLAIPLLEAGWLAILTRKRAIDLHHFAHLFEQRNHVEGVEEVRSACEHTLPAERGDAALSQGSPDQLCDVRRVNVPLGD